MSEPYSYSHLGPREIRLLQILPSDDEPRCSIAHHNLDTAPSYKALSYVWGDPTPCRALTLNHGHFSIALNLDSALRCLHPTEVGSLIWIDAICINQNDNTEKGSQVKMMGEIYRLATQVIVWLGTRSEDSDASEDWPLPIEDGSNRAMDDAVNHYGKFAFEAGLSDLPGQLIQTWPDVGDEPGHLKTRKKIQELMEAATKADSGDEGCKFPRAAFASLTQRAYFHRAWVKQEITLASDPIVVCGDRKAPAAYLHAAIRFYALWISWEMLEFQRGKMTRIPGPWSPTELLWMFTKGGIKTVLSRLAEQRASPAAASMLDGYWKCSHGQFVNSSHSQTLLYHLKKSYVGAGPLLRATYASDRIFSLLALSSDTEQLGIRPDYSLPVNDLYIKLARALIQQGNTDILAFCRPSTPLLRTITRKGNVDFLFFSRPRDTRLPSWVPDWSVPIRSSWSDNGTTSLFRASGEHSTSNLQTLNHPDTISASIGLYGIQVATLQETGSPWLGGMHDSFDHKKAETLFRQIDAFLGTSSALTRYCEMQRVQAQWRIPIADKESHPSSRFWRRATEQSRIEYKEIRKTDEPVDHLSYAQMMYYTFDARPFLAEGGFVGLCPMEAKAGDIVAVLLGGNVPFVLRKRGEGGYEVVGEAYVHGIMDGEVLEDNFKEDLETFHLY
jgi:hypothetical protein